MAHVTTVNVSYKHKYNLGNFESTELGCDIWAQIETDQDGIPMEDVDKAMHSLWSMAKANVDTQALPLTKKGINQKEIENTFLGLPVEKEEDKCPY